VPEERTRLSRHRSFFPRWRGPVGQEKWPSGNFWTSFNLNSATPGSVTAAIEGDVALNE